MAGNLTAAVLLDAWEAAAAVSGQRRGAMLVDRLGLVVNALDAPLAQRDAALLDLYRSVFGDRAEMVMDCTSCGKALEVDLDLAVFAGAGTSEVTCVVSGSREYELRALTTRDLVAAAAAPDPAATLLARTVRRTDGTAVAAADLPAGDLDLLDVASERLAGPAGVVVSARCPACGAPVRGGLDVAALGWSRLDRWAGDRLAEVATLARAYGWTEAEVLALTPARRAVYLELAQRELVVS
ncbi:hypothetical protein [Actinopolymorpha rutila]|uniref:Putative RNA-binding Zn-ribbon protein involved in translation (DUF1610 family) n=1 Tax=Actinopolymorpha rutila TaxID=446787 RepID=A0A852ZGN6_9ACTN|nr:hypothetical protein [Actinopolymorpha rutila]NYH90832.1 putative RNA-binding Zn-ribbon protein involved in translation (DUF1610 family) [Actinopolymorpha rutila]